MRKIIILIVLLYTFISFGQSNEIIYPKGKWYFGVEVGTNKIISSELNNHTTSFQAGILTEYYFGKQWSVVGKIKHFKTGVSFENEDSFFSGYSSGEFEGAVIAIPISIKWEFRLYRNLKGNLNTGLVLNVETSSSYKNYYPELEREFSKVNLGFTVGYGINYFLSETNAIFIGYEGYLGGSKGSVSSILGKFSKPTLNTLFNIGYKHHFKF